MSALDLAALKLLEQKYFTAKEVKGVSASASTDVEAPSTTTSKVLVFSSPPGGALDANGAFANSQTFGLSSVTANASTSPFATAPSSGAVNFLQVGVYSVMAWPAFTPVPTSGGTTGTWTWLGFVPTALRPLSVQTHNFTAENAGTWGPGTVTVKTNGDVVFNPTNTADPSTPGSWTGNSGSNTGFNGFSMAWIN